MAETAATFELMSSQHVLRTLNRIGRQIIEDNTEELPITLAGINERGGYLANVLYTILDREISAPINIHQLKIDGSSVTAPNNMVLDNVFLIIFDDVIFSGKTMYYAFHKAMDSGNPSMIKLAALIDRGHRKFPVEAQYTGMYSPTKFQEHVQCKFSKDGKPEGVELHYSHSTG